MRVSSCIFHCPFICFSKSSLPNWSPCPLKLKDAQLVSSSPSSVSHVVEEKLSDEKVEVENNRSDDGKVEIFLKSSLKKPTESGEKDVGKGRVKWMDLVGKELVEIREFEPTESEGDNHGDGNPSCICAIQ